MDDGVIITRRSALMKKYIRRGVTDVRRVLRASSDADRQPGIESREEYLKDATVMKKLDGKPVAKAVDPRANQ